VQEVDGGYAPDTSLTAAENLLTANPNLDLIYATGEPAVLGAMAGAESQNRDDLKICGWDLTEEIARGIEQGVVLATVRQDPVDFGRAAMETAVQLAQGESVEKDVAVPITIVTQENLNQFVGGNATPTAEGTPIA
ncbi:MAG: substrate-binding domain-containing protein, partial [Chloroflexi bacterium]|nr:substrate-binding domain-containing protein [Chloroflexota bacterium]